ncbi:hypothetical protein MKX03_031005 [Papaver bracteatum]|nr:hypothetical protein MKX03_031005 [Papaver bracteatum]
MGVNTIADGVVKVLNWEEVGILRIVELKICSKLSDSGDDGTDDSGNPCQIFDIGILKLTLLVVKLNCWIFFLMRYIEPTHVLRL